MGDMKTPRFTLRWLFILIALPCAWGGGWASSEWWHRKQINALGKQLNAAKAKLDRQANQP
jgi:hypothetical protein